MAWWQYLLLVNVYLVLFYGFYVLLLQNETFFRLNRAYLISSAILSFIIPVIQTDWVRNLFITQKLNQTIYSLDAVTIIIPQQTETGVSIGQVLAFIYLIGVLVLLLRLAIQFIKLQRAFKDPSTGNAFSFFGMIKINEDVSNEKIIASHEEVHARQWHSADVLLIEFITIINWFNPVVYLYRKAIKHIHEFIADSEIITHGTAKQDYAMLLLSQTFNAPVNQLANSFFNHSLLKQRIMMLHKDPSQRKALLKYGLSAPLFALMIILSSATAKTNRVITAVNKKAAKVMQLNAITAPAHNRAVPVIATVKRQPATTAIQTPKVAISTPAEQKTPLVTAVDTIDKNKIFTSVEESATPPGGFKGFYEFLGRNIRYPAAAREKGIQGRVICQFVVEQDGSLSDIKVVRGIEPSLDQEAVRVLSLSKDWTPGKHNGIAVRQQYTVPISFALNDVSKGNTYAQRKDPPPPPARQTVTDIMLNGKPVKLYHSQPPPPPMSPDGKPMALYIDTTGKRYNMSITGPKSPDYYLNNELADKKAFDKVSVESIESISIIKANPQNGLTKDQVRVITKKKP